MVELQPLLAEMSRTLNAPEKNSGDLHPPGLLQNPGLPKPCLPEECGEPQPCPGTKLEIAQPCPATEPGPPESSHSREPGIPESPVQEQPEVSEPCPPVEPGPLQADSHGQTGLLEPSPRIEPGASEACFLEPRSPESSPRPCCSPWAPATTNLIFSSQRPLCASPPIHSLRSLRPPTGQAGKELAGRAYEQRRSSSLTGSGPPPCTSWSHCLHFPTYPAPAWCSFGKKGRVAPRAVCCSWPLVGEWGSTGYGGSLEPAFKSLWSSALRPQQPGPSNPGSEAAPQSMFDCHPLLPRGPPG